MSSVVPAETMRTYVNKRTGKPHTVPDGIDPGFEWNPGEARAKALSTTLVERRNRFDLAFPPAPPQGAAVSAAIRSVAKQYVEPVQRAMQAIDSVHGVGTLPKIPIRAGSAKEYYGLFVADERGPVAIRLTGGDHSALTVIYEIGHLIDFAALPGNGFSSQRPQGGLKRVMKQIRKSPEVQALQASSLDTDYLLDARELFSRAYAQYIVSMSGDPLLAVQLANIRLTSMAEGRGYSQWTYEHFIPIQAAFELYFKELKWLGDS